MLFQIGEMYVKVVAFNGSPNENGNTSILLKVVGDELIKEGIEFELIQVGSAKVSGCMGCRKCATNKNRRCVIEDDVNLFIEKAIEADGIVIGSPVYFSNVTAQTKALIDRLGFVTRVNGNLLKGKVGVSVVAMRRAGANFAYSAINFLFGICEMIVPGSNYWNSGVGLKPGDVFADDEGMSVVKTLGENMASLMKKLHS